MAASEGRVYIDELEVFKRAMGDDMIDPREALNPAVLMQVRAVRGRGVGGESVGRMHTERA